MVRQDFCNAHSGGTLRMKQFFSHHETTLQPYMHQRLDSDGVFHIDWGMLAETH